MKMTVITDKKGAVVATYRHEEEYKEGQARFRLNALAGQSIHEIDMPAELEKITSAKELHSRLKEHLKKHLKKRKR
jgi:hypothetical protein